MKYLESINDHAVGAILESKLVTNPAAMLISKTFLLPFVSAKNPHKCELDTTPRKLIDANNPLVVKSKFKSHTADGIINIMPIVSIVTHIKQPPPMRKTKILNFPKPKQII